ncbi:N-acetylglucosamine-6-phosphate deacetylase [Bacillus ginsengihumi]|uniref:N-acetylglucosamine-6-phosphate deacetylase n=1 Tax=Heyndrickxia ginsengihumi TaxID=363870 RepID=A0A0A6VIE7_9BACI|nr:N-acetylglucosamine-6-phosphate deacetylase [Heyndrickxia ginsengihumi]KHD86404.1 N-acetylglucosamine-6-phosphate deacetylase [Heyndrickxia ginsengihumi]MBE6183393.1 N-acetylglucosamine-6-phosphate deacetylase [Bacillus sp. (in: firmicutes)]NEY19145.1 N-acetylglucosamine-6-phosphate deacetylase [Heyndrickxia ginsengihumi]
MTQKVLMNVDIYTGKGKVLNGYIRFSKHIIDIGSMDELQLQANDEAIDGNGKKVIPGMIDIHIHGGYDIDTMDANADTLVELSEKLLNEGVTSFFPTTMTQSYDAIERALQAVKAAKETGKTIIEGIHLEGPFISKLRAGAQPLQYIQAPDIQQFMKWYEASGELIKLVTYAPENEHAREFEELLINHGIVPSMGHSDAVRAELLHSKTTHATHMYNGMRGLHHREPGVAGHALLSPQIQVEMIADGLHVHPDMVKLTYEMKGPEKLTVITDAMRAKGLSDGESELGGQKVFVRNGEARLENGALAGSILTMDEAFRNIIAFTGCSIEDAVQMTSVNQAREFGLATKGELTTGKDADFVILDEALQVVDTYHLGKRHVREE